MAKTGTIHYLDYQNQIWKKGDIIPLITYRTDFMEIISLDAPQLVSVNARKNRITLLSKNGDNIEVNVDKIIDNDTPADLTLAKILQAY